MPPKTRADRLAEMTRRLTDRATEPEPGAEPQEPAELGQQDGQAPAVAEPGPAAAPAPRAARRTMPGEQARADKFPVRLTQTMTYEQADALDELVKQENRRLQLAGRERVYTATGMVRAAVAICLADPRLRARLVRVAAESEHTGRGRR